MIRSIVALVVAALLCAPLQVSAEQAVVICAQGVVNPTTGASSCATVMPGQTSTQAENSHVIKAAPGALFTAYATNLTATGGFLVLLNATSAPADGSIVPLDCVPLPANNSAGSCGPGCTGINYRPGPGKPYSIGITAVVTSANTCFTKTTGTITAFISGDAE